MGNRLADQVIVVTGSTRGIGAAVAEHCLREGAKVVVSSRKPVNVESTVRALETLAGELGLEGRRVLGVPCHTGTDEAVDELFAAALAEFGTIDGVVNNAATNPYFGPMINADWGVWDKTFDVNVKGYWRVARAALRHFVSKPKGEERGVVVNVTSVLGQMASPAQGIYGMTKAAVISMTQTLASEFGPSGVRVNAVAPGLVETRFAAALTDNAHIRDQVVGRTFVGRTAQPEDISGSVVFLLSGEARYITGHTLVVDGGWTAG